LADHIIASYADPRIRWSSTAHSGVAGARNRVVHEARGEVFRQRGDMESASAWRKKSEILAIPEAPAA